MQTQEDVSTLAHKLFHEKATWPELIKQIRANSEVDILTAEKIAISHDGWRRLCNYRINNDSECKKYARWHIEHHKHKSLIISVGNHFVIRHEATEGLRAEFGE